MKITVIGAGGAFAGMDRGNSAFMVEEGDRRILIDCGMTVPYILRDELGIPLQSITDVIVTHTHADHTGGLEFLLHACRWIGNESMPTIWAAQDVMMALDHALWPLHFDKHGYHTGWDYKHAVTRSVEEGVATKGPAGLTLTLLPTFHLPGFPSSAVILGDLAISGDTADPLQDDMFWNANLIFHDVEFGDHASGVHCRVEALMREAFDVSVPIYGYHCPMVETHHALLAGILKKGDVFEL